MLALRQLSVVAFAGLLFLIISPVVRDRVVSLPDPGTLDAPNDPLPPGAVARIGTIRLRSHVDIDRVAISPDAKLLVSTWGHGSLDVWDGRTGLLLRTIPTVRYKEEPRYRGEEGRLVPEEVAAMAFVADTGKFHVLTKNGLLRACDLTDGTWSEPLARTALPTPKEPYRWDAYGQASADGTRFTYSTSSRDNNSHLAEVFAVGQDKPVLELKGGQLGEWWRHSTFDADSKLITIARNGATIQVTWDVATDKPVTTFTGPGAHVAGFVLSRNGKAAAGLFSRDDEVRLPYPPRMLVVWDGRTGKEKFRVADWKARLVGFTHDGTKLIAHESGDVIVADAATGKVINRLKGHANEIRGFSFSANGTHLATCGGRDRSVIVWNLNTGKAALDIDAPRGPVSVIAFSPDGKTVFTATSQEHAGWLWDAESGKRKQRLIADGYGRPQTAAFTSDGQHVVVGYGYESTGRTKGFAARLWRVSDGKQVREFGEHADGVRAVVLSPDGKHLATFSRGGDDGVFLWELDTGKLIREARLVPHHASAFLAFPKDGELISLATSRLTGHNEAFNLWTGKFLGAWKVPHRADVHAISPDGKLVVTREAWSGVRDLFTLRSAKTGAEMRRLPVPNFDYSSPVAFSHDCKLVAVGETRYGRPEGDAVHVYDTATGKELRTFGAHTGRIMALAFSPDGKRLATGSTNTTVLIWDLTAKP